MIDSAKPKISIKSNDVPNEGNIQFMHDEFGKAESNCENVSIYANMMCNLIQFIVLKATGLYTFHEILK